MGVYMFNSPCFVCGRLFSFHPNKVPSIPVKDGKPHPEGTRMPICKECIDTINKMRAENGLPLIPYSIDAYKESFDEEEDYIDWNK